MDEHGVIDILLNRLPGLDYDDNEVADVSTFEDEGLLTGDLGVVLRMADGEEFQIFIKQIKAAD